MRKTQQLVFAWTSLMAITLMQPFTTEGSDICRVLVVDAENGWPVPLVQLRTTHNLEYVTDNAGVVAFDAAELMEVETWLTVRGHGYGVKQDGYGYQGVRVVPQPGKTIKIEVQRSLPGKRLGRITGGGMFAESQKLGEHLDWKMQGILGCDSVQNTLHNGRLFWAWGDTVLPGYPLGRFHMIGGTTQQRPIKSFEPPIKLRYDYFRDDRSSPRNIAAMPGDGPTWLSGFASLPDEKGQMRLVATYSKIQPPLTEYERGLCAWSESEQRFERFKVLWEKSEDSSEPPPAPMGHATSWTDSSGEAWILFGDPFPTLKFRPTFAAWTDPSAWETTTPQTDIEDAGGIKIKPHRGAIAWNGFRKKWVTIFTQMQGDNSTLGEIWYAESENPTGPWGGAIKVATHSEYTFYNPQLHPEFTESDSPILLFEGTYTHTFSKSQQATPRYDYNQVLYRLDLDEMFPENAGKN